MNSAADNPATNQIGAGINDAQILEAVQRSGYPLQTTVGDILRPDYTVQHEWSYVDRETKELRAIDIHARKWLFDWDKVTHPRVRPALDLLIECKQSQLPFVFFLSGSSPFSLVAPEIAGLRQNNIAIKTDDELSTFNIPVLSALDLDKDAFHKAPPYSNSFSKCVRKGADAELSGTEAYSGLILPLVKSLHHLRIAEEPVETAVYFDAHLIVPLGVLDAPMIAVSVENGVPSLKLTPWIRVLRHEYMEEAEKFERDRIWAIDIIHKDFLSVYLDSHLIPFAKRFSERALRHDNELATGKGFVPALARSWSMPVEGRLIPQPVQPINRSLLFFQNLRKLLPRFKTKE